MCSACHPVHVTCTQIFGSVNIHEYIHAYLVSVMQSLIVGVSVIAVNLVDVCESEAFIFMVFEL